MYVNDDDYSALGLECPTMKSSVLNVIWDSGAQSCLWSRKGFLAAGFSLTDLIPVNHKITAANSAPIEIDGAVILRLVGNSPDGCEREAAVIVYISPDSMDFFLSKEAMVQLGVIAPTFPLVGDTNSGAKADSITATELPDVPGTAERASCGCFVHAESLGP